jgi:putative copper export protein
VPPDGVTVRPRCFDDGVLPVDVETVRLFLHVLAATVWVGGQLVLAALVPALRGAGAEVPRVAAHAFNRVAWPAFAVLILTGVWNVVAEGDRGPAYRTTLMIKLTVVAVSGVTAFLHARATTRRGMAVFGALTGLTALLALLLGIVLAG